MKIFHSFLKYIVTCNMMIWFSLLSTNWSIQYAFAFNYLRTFLVKWNYFDVKKTMNLVKSQVQKIITLSKKADFSSSLGFMGAVKNEIFYITAVLRYMGVLLDKEIRLCLIIDDIDLLGKDKIMKLFQVVSLLQSSRNSSYLQILCMDPSIAANLIKHALFKELSSDISGHAFLKKHIQLPLHIPPLAYKPRNYTSQKIYNEQGHSLVDENTSEADGLLSCNKKGNTILLKAITRSVKSYLINYNCSVTINNVQKDFVLGLELPQFIDGNERTLRRATTSAQLAVYMMMLRAEQHPSPDEINRLVTWISFVDQWPYRVSWIRQTIVDNAQMHRIDDHLIRKLCDCALLVDVYKLVEAKLSRPRDWRNLLDLDGDPQLFIHFLHQYSFTVNDMKKFLPYTTNLNSSLRIVVAQCSAEDFIFRKIALHVESSQHRWLQSRPLEDWTADDVCNELEDIGMNEKFLETYREIIRKNGICGKTLCNHSLKDLPLHPEMTPGDWALFKHIVYALRTFYGITSHDQQVSGTACSESTER